jgi:predicted nucleic acid-binding protein
MVSIIPREVVIDTSVLIIALGYNFTRTKPIDERNKMLKRTCSSDYIPELIKLDDYFGKISIIHTTAHAIGELSGLVNSKLGLTLEQLKSFWQTSIAYFRNKQLNEQLIELINLSENKLYSSIIKEIGFVDAGLIKLAKDLNLPLVTNDRRTLKKYADKQNAEVHIFDDEIQKFV